MATKKPTHQSKAWSSKGFQLHVEITIASLTPSEAVLGKPLKRLLEPEDKNLSLQEAFDKAAKRYSKSKLYRYLRAVCVEYRAVRALSLVSIEEYRNWLRDISEQSLNLAALIDNVPSIDLLLPKWVNSVVPSIDAMLDGYGDDTAVSEFGATYHFRRVANVTPLKHFIRNISELAMPEKDTTPNLSWETELGIVSPTKMRRKGKWQGHELGYKQILTIRLKILTQKYFDKDENFLVACLVSELTGITTDPETVRKTPI